MTQLLIYQNLRIVNVEKDRNLKIREPEKNKFKFASHVNSILISGVEFAAAAKNFPIFFVQSEEGAVQPLALLGLNNEENLFVTPEGAWEPHTYIPAFFRRYPFVFYKNQENATFTLCVDEAFEGLNEEDGQALFNEQGKNSEYLENLLNFMREFERSVELTLQWCNLLKELDLFEQVQLNINQPNEGKTLNRIPGLMRIDEKKFNALEERSVLQMYHSGQLAWVYAHFHSLSNVQILCDRMAMIK